MRPFVSILSAISEFSIAIGKSPDDIPAAWRVNRRVAIAARISLRAHSGSTSPSGRIMRSSFRDDFVLVDATSSSNATSHVPNSIYFPVRFGFQGEFRPSRDRSASFQPNSGISRTEQHVYDVFSLAAAGLASNVSNVFQPCLRAVSNTVLRFAWATAPVMVTCTGSRMIQRESSTGAVRSAEGVSQTC